MRRLEATTISAQSLTDAVGELDSELVDSTINDFWAIGRHIHLSEDNNDSEITLRCFIEHYQLLSRLRETTRV